ncbi:DUF1801 domain-containing protein [Marivirga sp. S37H4]|uniref:DUF1801 domain-containing protein n=2 Tax=Marivirga aurantiaca TaxID=2802615 RepID=A0A935CBA3_9BACT|nr:DUF1801 domain-containing protein [Marivirga aurantiaca]
MRKSQEEQVQNFLNGINLMDSEKAQPLIDIREIILETYPEAKEKIMYGGIVFSLNNELFSGIFLNKNHITIEFSNGYLMKDPNGHLEGKGKYRRHLKVMKREDVLSKEIAYFVKQAV